jgi:hypothetical protein
MLSIAFASRPNPTPIRPDHTAPGFGGGARVFGDLEAADGERIDARLGHLVEAPLHVERLRGGWSEGSVIGLKGEGGERERDSVAQRENQRRQGTRGLNRKEKKAGGTYKDLQKRYPQKTNNEKHKKNTKKKFKIQNTKKVEKANKYPYLHVGALRGGARVLCALLFRLELGLELGRRLGLFARLGDLCAGGGGGECGTQGSMVGMTACQSQRVCEKNTFHIFLRKNRYRW